MKRKVGRPGRDLKVALDCVKEWLEGETEVEIGLRRGWKIQEDFYETPRLCRRAHRYIKDGMNEYIRKRRLREQTFGIEFKEPVRRKRQSVL